MSQYEPDAKTRFYQVNAWAPPGTEGSMAGGKYGRHLCVGCVADSAVEAIKAVQENHPLVRIDAVNDRGIVHINLRMRDVQSG